ncbi:MAG: alpha/beta hydrolase fold domain-containing protein, partial [Luteibaculum sp.]
MLKVTTTLVFVLCLTWFSGTAQNPLRFYNKVFPANSISIDTSLVYGSNYVYNALEGEIGLTEEEQTLDIYFPPLSDTLKSRPLIIWAHGGSFLGGTKDDADIVYFCKEFAERGFVTASINYRLGYEAPIDSIAAVRTVYRALQDGRAAVRFMRSVASEYNIDTNRIYFGGTSAGAFIATNMVYLNLPEEVPSYVDTSERLAINSDPRFGLDGIEGTTNDLSNSSEIHGVINFCGATKTLAW